MRVYKFIKKLAGYNIGDTIEIENTIKEDIKNICLASVSGLIVSVQDLVNQGFIKPVLNFKKGDWLFGDNGHGVISIFEYNGVIGKNKNYQCIQGIKYKDNNEINLIENDYIFTADLVQRLATKEEIKKALIEIAVQKGFKKGIKFKSCVSGITQIINRDSFWVKLNNAGIAVSTNLYNTSALNGDYIYYNGKWAEIIEEKPLKILGYLVDINNRSKVTVGCKRNISKKYFDAMIKVAEFCKIYGVDLSFYGNIIREEDNIVYKNEGIGITIKQIQEKLNKQNK